MHFQMKRINKTGVNDDIGSRRQFLIKASTVTKLENLEKWIYCICLLFNEQEEE